MDLTDEGVDEIVSEHEADIYNRLTLSPLLIALLAKESVITNAEKNKLKAGGLTPHQQIEIILNAVKTRGVDTFLDFCIVLDNKNVGLTHIVKMMGYKMKDIRDEKKNRETIGTDGASGTSVPQAQAAVTSPKPVCSPVSSGTKPEHPPETAEDKPHILTAITSVTADKARRILDDPDDNYPMRSNPRGRAIILSIDKFKNPKKDRKGGNLDANNLSVLFDELGFTVDSWYNLSAEQIKWYIKEECSRKENKDYDAFVMCVMSHGDKGRIYDTDSVKLRITEDIVNQFSAVNAPGLAGKPKMFFIQACQGPNMTTGHKIQADGADDLEDLMREIDGDATADAGIATHELADILVVNSTLEGYKAFRDTELGSFFMQDLISVFREQCHEKHVADMIVKVTNKLDARIAGEGQYKQICSTKSTLKRNVYFLPGHKE